MVNYSDFIDSINRGEAGNGRVKVWEKWWENDGKRARYELDLSWKLRYISVFIVFFHQNDFLLKFLTFEVFVDLSNLGQTACLELERMVICLLPE